MLRIMRTPETLTIVTGSSRGLGQALVARRLQAGHTVLGIARQRSEALDALALERGATLLQWSLDLADAESAGFALLDWLQALPTDRFSQATLINNAGVLAPPGPLADSDPADTVRVLRVGLEAAMTLTGLFLRGTRGWDAERRVMNISSGLGRRAMAGSAAYCAAKAGLDHFTRAVALEEAETARGARLVSIAPGVIDTDMQQQLRGADASRFSSQPQFESLHSQGLLLSPDEAAERLLAWLERPDFGQTVVADVREA